LRSARSPAPGPRGKTAAEDLAFEKDLIADEKELAEHLMLVDLPATISAAFAATAQSR